jgi:hypothetical protein
MNDEEFKKKLETILENLYKIDQEVKEYLNKEKLPLKKGEYRREPYGGNYSELREKYKNDVSKTYNRKQQSL